ncbi:RNA methyltransferase [Hydrotalea flava]|uniref:RNA methyltransferase n=1 Tax=Hydrotalea flava TaxID=714549 RepID=UPI0008320B9A|nr:RNA methyltransferase [Hydrotalea flava]
MQKLSMDALGRKSVQEFKASAKHPLIVVLDNIRSMHNVGSIFRTCDAFLMEGICICGYTPQPPHRDIHKTALGATETVDWMYVPTASAAVHSLKSLGYSVWGVEQAKGSVPLQQFAIASNTKIAIVLGNEVEGVSEDALSLCDGCIEIPQWGTKHSLNVSVAAGIVLWELVKKIQSF